ncbi:MAG TPA: hypothetical protein ENK19_03930 [Acidobacteria bacterium]|nr:hypothetical protein [Acidobacteriota bacterium]
MPLLIDGNNLAYRLAGSADRDAVRRKVLDFVRGQKVTVTLFFDGPSPAGRPDREVLGPVTVLYGGRRSADDLIVQRIPSGPHAASFTVVTDDRALARRVRNAGGQVLSLSGWMERLERRRPPATPTRPEAPLSASEVEEWERFFAGGRPENGES